MQTVGKFGVEFYEFGLDVAELTDLVVEVFEKLVCHVGAEFHFRGADKVVAHALYVGKDVRNTEVVVCFALATDLDDVFAA
jgi:hypothetical protein